MKNKGEKIMNDARSFAGRDFWLRWVLLTVAGYFIGFFMGFVLGHFLLGNIMIGSAIGAMVGFMQWLMLRYHIQRSGRWVLTNMAGLTVSLSLYAVAVFIWEIPFDLCRPYGVLGWAAAFGVGGALAGIWQQRILKNRLSKLNCWIPASAIGWCLSIVGLGMLPTMSSGTFLVMLLRNIIGPAAIAGIILGSITGGVLIYLLREEPQK